MKIALITPTPPDISAFGVRSLSAYLKSCGHEPTLVFLPGGIDRLEVEGGYSYRYRESLLADLVRICSDCELIGLSFMTQYLDRACQITDTLRQNKRKNIVWGGFHPTLCPQDSLEFADYVIEAEGEIPLENLIAHLEGKLDWEKVPNTWRIKDGHARSPNNYHWMNEIDFLPDYDFSLERHYVSDLSQERLVPLDDELFYSILPKMPYFDGRFLTVYRTMSSRGCPHQCSYCINRTLRQRYCQGTYLRRRSVEKVLIELENITRRFPRIQGIHFFDDSFFSNKAAYLNDFADRYRTDIGLPFYCQGSPESIQPKKLEGLIEAGLVFCEMGIQTGSEKIAQLYHRTSTNEQIREAIRTIDFFQDHLLKPHYHVIVDNPWGCVQDDLDTLNMLLEIPHHFMLCLASLTLFPGTELHQIAIEEGKIKDAYKDIYRKAFYKPQSTYVNLLITLTDNPFIPKPLLRFLARPALVNRLQRKGPARPWSLFMSLDKAFRYLLKTIEAVRYGNFWRLKQFLKRQRVR
ncbi:cobalamin-dependent protein [bacterium]|nr:cobalamin-dependent protein [bacterium]